MKPLVFEVVPDSPETKAEKEYWARATRTPHCYQCGRFCSIISDRIEYNGSFNQNYVTFDCKRCGVYTEGMW